MFIIFYAHQQYANTFSTKNASKVHIFVNIVFCFSKCILEARPTSVDKINLCVFIQRLPFIEEKTLVSDKCACITDFNSMYFLIVISTFFIAEFWFLSKKNNNTCI